MYRTFTYTEPIRLNKIIDKSRESDLLQIATTNKNKINEFKRLMPGKNVEGISLNIDEIQSLDHIKVASEKAKAAFIANKYNPVLIEDTSLEIMGLGGKPGTYAADFIEDVESRRIIVKDWLKGKDRRAKVIVTLAIYDGKEVYTFEGICNGKIAKELKGTNGFAFDDMFIPEGQSKNNELTFAQMTSTQKDKYSMRRKAINEFLSTNLNLERYTLQLEEPFESEIKRVQENKLNNKKALKFAYSLEATIGNKENKTFEAKEYKPIHREETIYYRRYSLNEDSASIGLIVTNVDKANIELKQNGDTIIWQMGPQRRKLALAQRAEYFIKNTDPKIFKIVEQLEDPNNQPIRVNKKHATIENLLRLDYKDTPFQARAIKEIGYKKLASNKEISRSSISQYGLFNKIGKYPRLMFGIGSMPAVSGWRDVILTSIIGHMPVFISRNNIFAENTDLRIKLIRQVKEELEKQNITKKQKIVFARNIGVALGTSNPENEVKKAIKFYKEGIKLFRIYTINADPRFVKTAELLRKEFGEEIEIFAGQLVDKDQALKLIEKANVDGIIFGHGGGRQCTSATNGMALSTIEEIYSLVTDERFNNVSLLVEGGVGRSVGGLIVLGIDGILYNQQFTKGTIETGGIFLQNKDGGFGQPYHGSASAPTMIIEAASGDLADKRLNYSGRTKVPEGKRGFTYYSEKANSMAFWIDEFKHQAARTFADLGVENFKELREFILSYDKELLRIVSSEAAGFSQAYRSSK